MENYSMKEEIRFSKIAQSRLRVFELPWLSLGRTRSDARDSIRSPREVNVLAAVRRTSDLVFDA
jgi:hypothetical protein